MKILVTYRSKTGFTKRYAEWISEELKCDLKEVSKVGKNEILEYDLVIHGGWIMGGMINGFNKIKKFNPKRLIVFGVGYTPKCEVDLANMITFNNLGDIPLFYFEGGMNPKKMGFIGRSMVKAVTKKKLEFIDNTKKENIFELIKMVNGLNF